MQNKTILVVDDDPLNIRILNEILLSYKWEKFEILNANNGILALKIAKTALPDVIIADWEMPEMNGIELIKALKAAESTQEIPVIMATGVMMTSEDLDIALAAGAADYIRKPIDVVEMRARLRSALQMADHVKEIRQKTEIIGKQEKELLQNNINILQNELNNKHRQLAANISFLTQLDSEKKDHIEDLNTLKPFLNAEGRTRLNTILQTMENSDYGNNLLELENRFDEINHDFFKKLEQHYPSITKSEKLLCAYSLLKLTPTEISRITGKNLNSLNVGFSRIRSKFNVTTNGELNSLLEGLS